MRRRTRNETNTERSHTCGCGKTYLSYPALYLHQKIKHGGQQPMGTVTNKKAQPPLGFEAPACKPEPSKTDDSPIHEIASLLRAEDVSILTKLISSRWSSSRAWPCWSAWHTRTRARPAKA